MNLKYYNCSINVLAMQTKVYVHHYKKILNVKLKKVLFLDTYSFEVISLNIQFFMIIRPFL